MPGVHAKLSASSASRWITCPGSVSLEEGIFEGESPYAAEGTLAHALCELKLKKYFFKGMGPVKYRKAVDELKKDPLWQDEMDRYTDVYFNAAKKVSLTFEKIPFVAIEEKVDFSKWVPEGFGTADFLLLCNHTLIIMDFKYGKGVPVYAKDNPQLMLYALGAYQQYSAIYDIQDITLWVIQPRIDNLSPWTLSVKDLLAFGERIQPIAKAAYDGSNDFKAGDHCRFCRAKARCPARAKTMFEAVDFIEKSKKEPNLLNGDEIGEILKKAEGLTDYIKDLQAEALKLLLSGEKVSGYKAVEGRSNREITDEKGLAEALIKGGYEEALIYMPRKIETITNLEKMVGATKFKTISKPYITKPQGKPTLVPESDKRPIYKKDAAKMFEKIN